MSDAPKGVQLGKRERFSNFYVFRQQRRRQKVLA
jgi:hypothetical protein